MPSARISGKLPKGDRNGLDDGVVEALRDRPAERRLYVVVMHATKIEHDVEGDDDVVHLTVDQVELIDRDVDHIDAALVRESMLRAQQRRSGRRVLPFELRANLEELFPNLITDDERERREDDELTEVDRLRKHLERVHGYTGDGRESARIMTATEAADTHRTDHENDRINHPTAFDGWTRAEVAGLPRYVLAYSTTGEAWELLDRAGRGIAGAGIAGVDVDKARTWAAEQIEILTGAPVIRWHNSDIIEGAWLPVIDDQAPKRSDSHADEIDKPADPVLFEVPDEPASATTGQPGEATPAADAPDASAGEEDPDDDEFSDRRAAADPSLDHSSHSLQWVGECPECPPERPDAAPVAEFSHPERPGDAPVDLDSDTRRTRA